jgi:peptidoglycan/xylan/chitin deacetylase (PgdA/CDA1 family)
VALTFDDGPDPRFTPPLLELLARHQAQATFFVSGMQVAAHPALAGRMHAAGHELGIHCWEHQSLRWCKQAVVQDAITRTREALQDCGVEPAPLFRPPYMRMGWDATREAAAQNLTLVGQSWKTHDYDAPSVEWLVKRVLRKVKPGDILIFHDGGADRSITMEALQTIIPQLQARGLQLKTVGVLLEREI